MLDIVDGCRFFEAGILKQESFYKPPMNINVDILVDRCRNQEPGMLAVVGWQVGAAAAQRDSKW